MKTKNKKQTETREAEEEDASHKNAPTDNTKSPIHGAVQESEEREGVDEMSTAALTTTTTTTTTAGNKVVIEGYSVPLPNDHRENLSVVWSRSTDAYAMPAVDEESLSDESMGSESTSDDDSYSDSSSSSGTSVEDEYDEFSTKLKKFNESASQVYNQAVNGLTTAYASASQVYNQAINGLTTAYKSASQVYNQAVNGLTTAYVRTGEDLSLIGLALTETKAAKSLNALMEGKINETSLKITERLNAINALMLKEEDGEEKLDGEGMEISLDNRIGDSRTVAEI